MPKEPYVKPQIRSESLEPGALGAPGSDGVGGGGGNKFMLSFFPKPCWGVCCSS